MYCSPETIYYSLSFYWKWWQWGYAIMRIRDTNGDVKLRLAKCKKHHGFPKTIMHEWDRVDESEIENLSQVNHVNFKTVEKLKACYLRLLEEFQDVWINNLKLTSSIKLVIIQIYRRMRIDDHKDQK